MKMRVRIFVCLCVFVFVRVGRCEDEEERREKAAHLPEKMEQQSRRVTTVRQLEMMLEFLENHRDLALGRIKSKEFRATADRLWRECAEILNPFGPIRTGKEWAKVWNDQKCKVRAKLVAINSSRRATGGGPSQEPILTPLENKVACIIGMDVGPLPNVMQDQLLLASSADEGNIVEERIEQGSEFEAGNTSPCIVLDIPYNVTAEDAAAASPQVPGTSTHQAAGDLSDVIDMPSTSTADRVVLAARDRRRAGRRRTHTSAFEQEQAPRQAQCSIRRTTTQSSVNGTRDSQLLSLLAARRRQLLTERLTTHVNTLAALGHKANKSNTTFAQLEIRDSNSTLVKKLVFENASSESTPMFKLVTSDGSKEIRQEIKPHEIRHHFILKNPENRNRAAFVNNRRKPIKSVTLPSKATESSILYVPPDKLEEFEKEVEIDPDEEFQVDESNHGLYLLNYSDTENVTQAPELNITMISTADVKENMTTTTITTEMTPESNGFRETTTVKSDEEETNTIANSTDNRAKVENENNQTLFMSDEIYNHFRPLETELRGEDMAPFKYFGQKLGGAALNDNLTNSPSLSASTKSVNYIGAPSDKRKFNSRYSATEKYKNTSTDEEEINEDMDVSIVKNVIEKNKIRNTVKGPAPARHVGLVSAYRKYSSSTPAASNKTPTIAQLNVTEPMITYITPVISDTKGVNKTSDVTKDVMPKFVVNNSTKETSNRTVTTPAPRNFTRSYLNIRRKPSNRVAASTINENILPTAIINTTTTEKASTVYTAVVTSISITSSVKGLNKTEPLIKDVETNATVPELQGKNITTTSTTETVKSEPEIPTTLKPKTTTTVLPSFTRSNRHRFRIRTSTVENTHDPSPTANPLTSEPPKQAAAVKNETASRSDRLASLYGYIENTTPAIITAGSPIRTKDIVKRRRPTTTTSTSTTPSPAIYFQTISYTLPLTTEKTTTQNLETMEAIKPIITSRFGESSSVPKAISRDSKTVNTTEKESPANNEEVVIEAEKTYTASYVLAGLGFLPVAAIVAFVLRSVLNKKTKEIHAEYEGYFDDSGDVKKESPITPVARPPIPTPAKPDTKWEFPRNKLRLQTLLGQGNFGQVWKAEADDLNGHDGLTRLVAVKSIKETASQKEKQELLHEILIMQNIGTHPNVVTLLACCTELEPYLLIMEYVMCGKLLTYLRERRSRPDRFSGSGALTSRDLTVFAYCVARGMDYIASKGIVHRDLAARNVLVDHNKLCKIADFGMSRNAGAAARAPRGALPVRWMAPEALLYNVYSHHSDVWAFGILLWEIVTLGSTPYAAMSGREVLTAVTEGYRLERPPHCKPQLYHAMHACWHADPSQRPSFATLKSQLAELLDNEPSEGNYVDLDSFYQESSVYSDPSAIINDEEGLSAEYDRERSCFRELATSQSKFENRGFNLRDEELRNKFGIGTPRMGGFGIRDLHFNERNFSDGEFNERTFSDKSFNERNFAEQNFNDRNFVDKNFNDTNFTERKDGKLSTSSFHRERERERERENPVVSRNSFNGFPRIGTRDGHFQMSPDGRNKRVPEFECDI